MKLKHATEANIYSNTAGEAACHTELPMPSASDHNNEARKKAFKMLEEAEKKRASIRLERGLVQLRDVGPEILGNTDFTSGIAGYLHDLAVRGEMPRTLEIIELLFSYLENERHAVAIRPILEEICTVSVERCNVRLLKYLTKKYCAYIEDRGGKIVITAHLPWFLAKSCGMYVRSNLWHEFDETVSVLWKVRNRTFITEEGKQTPFKDIFSQIAAKDVVEKLLRHYLTGDQKKRDFAVKTLGYLGKDASLHLLNRLVFSQNKEERFLLVSLLAVFGEDILPTLQTFMEEDLPWYALRNLIALVGEIGNPRHYSIIEGYLIHSDVRVQNQVITTALKLAGQDMEKRLVQALPVVDDSLKLKLAMQLGGFSSRENIDAMLAMISQRKKISAEIRDEMVQKLCVSLRAYPYPRVIQALKELQRELEPEGSDNLLIIVEETIQRLQPKIRHRLKEEKADMETLSYGLFQEREEREATGVEDFVEEIEQMIDSGKIEKASSAMYKKIVDLARAKDFDAAEMLRDKLLEINPDALQDVISLSEKIEEEKTSSSSSVQAEVWEGLFNTFSSAEYDFLLTVLRTEKYDREERIVSAGEIDPCLYFLNAGLVQLSCASGARETFLKRITPGDVVGVNPFFSASVWTVSMTALHDTTMLVLRRDLLTTGEEKPPHFEEKLLEFCRERESIPDLLRMSGQERRNNARYAVKVTVNNVLLDIYGGSTGKRVFHGEMIDISRGGLAFAIRISKKQSAHLLLGRQIVSEITLKGKKVLRCLGLIVGVTIQHELLKEYSVHIKFYQELGQRQVTDVLNLVL